MDKIARRAFPAFATGFALYYAPAYAFTGEKSPWPWPLFTYFPETGDFKWGLVFRTPDSGPPMWWYGWIGAAVIVGLIFAAIAMALPEKSTVKLWTKAVWVVPVLAFVFLMNWEMQWFVAGWQPLFIPAPQAAAPGPGGPPPPAAE